MNSLPSLTPLPYAPAGSSPGAAPATQPGAISLPSASPTTSPVSQSNEFRQLLSLMMLSMTMSSSGQSSGGSMGMGMSMSEMIAPLMFSLIEKLMAAQVETAVDASPQPSGRPVQGPLTQEFHPGHNGLDFGIPVGTPIQATLAGKVVYAGWNDEGYGNLVIVENGPYRAYYAHLSEIPVTVGQWVTPGSVIGLSGNTGNSTGPHLHYEVRLNNRVIDPTSFTLI